ncbi:MAG: hypothetical protein JXB20_04375 [Bacilli bacterium]|nr:hypothetical protein [Bacilli bacterium]
MKSRFIALVLFVFLGLFLAGCDFFGGGTITIPTTFTTESTADTSATESTGTTVVTTTAVSSDSSTSGSEVTTVTTVSSGTETTTTSGSEVTTVTTVSSGTETTTTATVTPTTTVSSGVVTTTTTTVVPTTTTTTTAVTTAPTTAVTTTETTTEEVITVVFLNADGTILATETILPGESVTPPADPTMADSSNYRYTFVEWDHDMTGIMESVTIRALYDVEYLGSTGTYDHAMLLALMQGMTPDYTETNEEMEEQIGFMMGLLGIPSEEHFYVLMSQVPTLLTQLEGVTNATDFTAWYQSTKTAGFTEEVIVDAVINALMFGLRGQVEYFDIDYMYDDIAYQQGIIDTNTPLMEGIRAQVVDYCNTSTPAGTDCIQLFDYMVDDYHDHFYYQEQSENYLNSIDWNWEIMNKYYELENLLNEYIEAMYHDEQPLVAAEVMVLFDTTFAALNPELQAELDPLLDAFLDWKEDEAQFTQPLMNDLWEVNDTEGYAVSYTIQNQYFNDYLNMFWSINNAENEIHWMEEEIQRRLQEHAQMELIYNYLQTPEGMNKLKLLVISIYDVVDALALNVDPDLFALVMSLATDPMFNPESLLTAENIVLYVDKVVTTLRLVQTTFGTEEIDNLGSIAEDVITLFIDAQDMPEAEKEALKFLVIPQIDAYLTMAATSFDDILTFLDSIDLVKAQAILDAVTYFTGYVPVVEPLMVETGPAVEDIVYIANLVEVMIGDDSLDLASLMDNMITVYFDMTYFFQADSQLEADVRTNIQANLARLLEMAPLVGAIDPLAMTMADYALLEELIARLEAFGMMFEYGLESMLEPIAFGYDHQKFVDLAYEIGDWDMTSAEAEQLILDLMAMLEETDEETAYYLMMSIMMHVGNFYSVDSFTDLKSWIDGFYGFGMTKPEMASTILNFLVFQMDQDLGPDGWLAQDVLYYTSEIAENQALIVTHQGYLNQIDADVLAMLVDYGSYTQAEIDAFMAHWGNEKEYIIRDIELHFAVSRAGYDWNFSYDTYYNLDDLLWMYYEYGEASYLDDYNSLYAMLSPEEQAIYGPLLTQSGDFYSWINNVYWPAYNSFDEAPYEGSGVVEFMYGSAVYDYEDNFWSIKDIEDWIFWDQIRLDDVNREIASKTAMRDYLADPLNEVALETLMVAAMDELDNMMNLADPATFDIFTRMIFERIGYYYVASLDYIPEEPMIDMSPEAILGYVQDVAVVLDGLFTTMDPAEDALLLDFIADMIEMQFVADGMTQIEIDAQMLLIEGALAKWYPRVEEVLDIVIVALQGLDITEVDQIMKVIPKPDQEPSMLQIVNSVAILANVFTNDITPTIDDTLDYAVLLDYMIELYYDVKYQLVYTNTEMQAIQDVVANHMTDLLPDLYLIAAIQPGTLTDADLPLIYETVRYGEWLAQNFSDLENMVYPAPSFTYVHQDFVDLVMKIHGDWLELTEVEALIVDYMAVFETTDEATAFYKLLIFGSVAHNLEYIDSFHSLVGLYFNITSLGFSKEQLTTYVINFIAMKLNEEATYIQERITELEGWIADSEQGIIDQEANISLIIADIETEIATLALTYPSEMLVATQMLDTYMILFEQLGDYYEAIVIAKNLEGFYFDSYIYTELVYARFGDEWDEPNIEYYNDLVSWLTPEESSVYLPLLDLYQAWNYTWEFDYNPLYYQVWAYEIYTSSSWNIAEYIDDQCWQVTELIYDIKQYNEWILSDQHELDSILKDSVMLNTMLYYLSDVDMSSYFPSNPYAAVPNTELAADALVVLMNRFETLLPTLTPSDMWQLEDLFGGYYEVYSPYEVVEVVKIAMKLFGPLLIDASGTSGVDSELNTLLNRLFIAYANSVVLETGQTVEDVRFALQQAVFDVIDLAYLVNELDPYNLTTTDIELVYQFLYAIDDVKFILAPEDYVEPVM